MKKTYLEAFTTPEESAYYLMLLRASEERGGSDKAVGLLVSRGLNDLLSVRRDGIIYHVRNGAMFSIGRNEDGALDRRQPLSVIHAVEKVVDGTFNPSGTGWESLVYEEDAEEDEVPRTQPHYVVVTAYTDWATKKQTQRASLTLSWRAALGALVADENSSVSIYKVRPDDDGVPTAKLMASNASVEVCRELEEADNPALKLAQYRTGFSQYDFSVNPYIGCEFKCKYCYAGVYRDYADLPRNIWRGRMVIGTHTDPYQPREAEDKDTRYTLEAMLDSMSDERAITKVGIFTRGTLIERDLDLIAKLPNPVIHFDLSPYEEDVRATLEKSEPNVNRLETLKAIKAAGIKLILNVCPCIPTLSESVMDSPLFHEAYAIADEICVGLLVMYGGISTRLDVSLPEDVTTMLESSDWIPGFLERCRAIFAPYYNDKLVIWRDRTRLGWKKMSDGSALPQEFYKE